MNSNQDPREPLYTVNEAATYLRKSRRTIYNMINDGVLTARTVHDSPGFRMSREDLDAILKPVRRAA